MKKTIFSLIACLSMVLCIPVLAEEYDYSDEDYWYSTCSKAQSTEEGVNACLGFQEHLENEFAQLRQEMKEYKDDLDSLEGNSKKIEALVKKQKKLTDALESQIANMENQIAIVQGEIDSLKKDIRKKEKEIKAWEKQIQDRMLAEQVNSGTNVLIDLIMGSSNLNDMFRRFNGVERITASDQDQIEKLNAMKQELLLKKKEQERLNKELEGQKQRLVDEQAYAKELKASYDQLAAEYHKVEGDLRQKMQEEAARQALSADVTSGMLTSYSGSLPKVGGFASPISGGRLSAGTWAYPGGGLHLGMDWAVGVGTPLRAPASGVIIYASNPAPSMGGFLGNWVGWPFGGGNTIEMLCNVNGTLYAVAFYHLSQEGFAVSAGMEVSQGQIIALTGNSGNSSGAHCHIEVYNLGNMSVESAVAQFGEGADFAWGTGWNTTSTACEAGAGVPCRERPERFF